MRLLARDADDFETHHGGAIARDESANARFFFIYVGKARLALAEHFGEIAAILGRQ